MRIESQIFYDSRLKKIIEDAILFVENTDYCPLSISEFVGSGVYLLYYEGSNELYAPIRKLKINNQRVPIYVGKAVPRGSRQGHKSNQPSKTLFTRLKRHMKSINSGEGISIEDFSLKFIILNSEMSNLIGTLESELINRFSPIWNSCIDGFGNNDPGKGRAQQAKSEWDTLHPGRSWANKLTENKLSINDISLKAKQHLKLQG